MADKNKLLTIDHLYHSLADFSDLGHLVIDRNLTVISINDKAKTLLNDAPMEAILGTNFTHWIGLEQKEEFTSTIKKIIEKSEGLSAPLKLLNNTKLTYYAFREESDIKGLVVNLYLKEINTNRPVINETHYFLRNTEFQALFEATNSFIIDNKGKIKELSDTLYQLSGYSIQETIGKNVRYFFSSFENRQLFNDIEKAVNKGNIWRGRLQNKNKYGRFYWTDTVVFPIATTTNQVLEFLVIMNDITNQLEHEQQLSDSIEQYKKSRDKLKTKNNELKKLHQISSEYERRLKESQEVSQTGNWELDIYTQRLYWSDQVYKIFDVTKEEFEGSNQGFIQRVHPEDREKLTKAYDLSVLNKDRLNITHRILTKKGNLKYVEERCQTVYDKSGKPLKSIGVVVDITQRVKREQELEMYKQLLDQAQSMAKLGGWSFDLATSEFIWTKETFRIHGVPFGKAPDIETAINFYHPDDRALLKEANDRLIKKNKPYDLKFRFHTAQNKMIYVRTSGQPVVKNGKVIRINGTIQDITEQALLEKTAEEERQKYIQTLEQTNEPVITINSRNIIQIYNQAAERLFGYQKDEMIGQPLTKLFQYDKTLQKDHSGYVRQNLKKGQTYFDQFMREFTMFTKNGQKFIGQINLSKIHLGDEIYYVAFIRDLTKDIELKEALEKELKNNLKATIVGQEIERERVARELHDGLGQTLTAAKLSLGALLQDFEHDKSLKNKLQIIKQMVDDCVIENRRISLSMLPKILEDLGLQAAIKRTLIDAGRPLGIKTQIELKKGYLDCTENPKIIYRIIQEAIHNAIKHSGASSINICLDNKKNKHIFVIKDDGKGFDPKKINKGLGLINMRQRANSINGEVEISSHPEKGTRINIVINCDCREKQTIKNPVS